jgi:hypothetical protein
LYDKKLESIPIAQHANAGIPSLLVCLQKIPEKVLEYLAGYDNQTEVYRNAQTQVITFVELGKISSILLRRRFRELLVTFCEPDFVTITSFVKTKFWLDYEKDELHSKINDKILTTPFFKTRFNIEKYLQIRDLPVKEISAEDQEMRDDVKTNYYLYKKRMFQSIFRKTPDQHQNVALILHILQLCPGIRKYLIFPEKIIPTLADSALRYTWHMNSLKYPEFSKLRADWKRWSQHSSSEPKWKWHVSNYGKDIYGWHTHRDELWPKIVQQLEKDNHHEYLQLLQLADTRSSKQTRMDTYLQMSRISSGKNR